MKEIPLGHCCIEIRNGKSIKQDDALGGFPITRIETISNRVVNPSKVGYAGLSNIDDVEEYVMKKGDLLLSHINSPKHLGKSAFYDGSPSPLVHGMNLLRLRVNVTTCFPKYLWFWTQSLHFKAAIEKISNQSVNQASFSVTSLRKVLVPLPPLEEQKRIAEILDEADRVRKKTQALIEKYDELAQSLFLDMFGDPVTNPKGWEVKTVDECCLVTDYVANGSFASLKANVRYNYDKDFAVLVRTTDNTKGWSGNYVYVPESSFHFLSKSELSKGDLIIANVGDPGKCFLCPDLGQPMTLGPNSILVRSLVEKLNQPYLYHLFASSSGQRMIDRICSATAQKKFNKTSFRALEIPVPDAKTLDKFGQVIETHERQIGYEKNQLNKTEALFNSLLQKAFKGELT